jgi:hypothetical protein
LEVVKQGEDRVVVRVDNTFESGVLKDWGMPVCGVHAGWMEGMLPSVTGKNWVCEESKCCAAGDEYCEFVAEQREVTLKDKAVHC